MLEPLANPFIAVSKKYLSALSKMVAQLSIDRYHYVLILIDSHDENLTQKALAEILHIDKSYMVTILDYLEERGYAMREKNPQDRREQLIRLTPKAESSIPIIREAIKELNEVAFQNICESKKQIFNEVLTTIQFNLIDNTPELEEKTHSILKNYN
ncbi:MarR family winged helix-turn-helix transcriptional regulator [Daejeonella sp.]|uniref:MarR family winged helix-turn-helix transcriptional regulator n=1 Tax=Daejeonella sp. TaxID=2805397 RepID=UPI00271C130C|nr:MarR family transcriptional regulator [Daejeonella sp.]MDO8992430.1 MarR family transcriptional regulator [Daejeonella sp.]MDP2412412.1 MarR family transcriptional regulator [Daejeonella sp.]